MYIQEASSPTVCMDVSLAVCIQYIQTVGQRRQSRSLSVLRETQAGNIIITSRESALDEWRPESNGVIHAATDRIRGLEFLADRLAVL